MNDKHPKTRGDSGLVAILTKLKLESKKSRIQIPHELNTTVLLSLKV